MIPEHYRELDQSAVLFEPPSRWLVVEGPDRVSWLQGMVSNDVGRLDPGQGCQAAHLTAQGKVVAIMTVLAESERLCLLVDGIDDHDLASQLDRMLIMEDATIEDRSSDVRSFLLIGGRAEAALKGLLGPVELPTELHDHVTVETIRVVRSRQGFDLIVETSAGDQVRDALASHGVVEGSDALLELVSIEAGRPRWGTDVNSEVMLPELGEDAIDYQKGCYIGQEVVARIKYIGRVNRKLMGLRLAGEGPPTPGGIEREGRDVGRLTSAAYSPASGCVIALAYVKRGSDAVGTEVDVVRNGVARRAVVVALPFVERTN